MSDTAPPCSPGSHPHSDQPNWKPAETIEEYINNVEAGLEEFSERRAAKLFGVPRMELYRWKLMAELPPGLLDYILDEARKINLKVSNKALAQIALAHRSGENKIAEVDRCPHCGGVLRVRGMVSNKLLKIVNEWIVRQSEGAA